MTKTICCGLEQVDGTYYAHLWIPPDGVSRRGGNHLTPEEAAALFGNLQQHQVDDPRPPRRRRQDSGCSGIHLWFSDGSTTVNTANQFMAVVQAPLKGQGVSFTRQR